MQFLSDFFFLGLPWAVITTKWFVCLFAEVLPIETVLRIWDCLFYEGSKILFRVCITLIKNNRALILSCNDFTSLAECFKAIVKNASALHCHEFMQVSLCLKQFHLLHSIFKFVYSSLTS